MSFQLFSVWSRTDLFLLFVPFSIQEFGVFISHLFKNNVIWHISCTFLIHMKNLRKQGSIFSCMYQKVLLCQVLLDQILSFPFSQAWLWPPYSNINSGPNSPNSNVHFYLYHICLTLFFWAKNEGQNNLIVLLSRVPHLNIKHILLRSYVSINSLEAFPTLFGLFFIKTSSITITQPA